ncbi:hypothetical protein PWT90_01133 [Aphanocladium album]|nr:hypothetical protein PWT90_01133 [Aphanocladium album]
MAAPKIIVLGSLNGNLRPALTKLAVLHAKNAFALALLTGDVFLPDTPDDVLDALFDGTIAVPLPTYFTVGNHPLPERIVAKITADEEICPNLHFLGKRSVTKTSDGLRIASLGGVLDPHLVAGASKEQHLPFFTEDDAKSLKGANSADVLLTSTWPAGIWNGSSVALSDAHKGLVAAQHQSVADLCAALKPRYHLTASPGPFFYEREPFVQAADAKTTDDIVPITRFIAMAPYGNEAKAKAFYAFTLNKSDSAVPPGATASPLLAPRDKKRPRNDDGGDDGSYSRYGNQHGQGSHHGRRQKRSRQQQPPPGPDQCFFCLSNPNIATHMVCSIGDDAYITTAKGPLPTSTTFAEHGVGFPSHFIIIPLPHAPTLGSLSGGAAAAAAASSDSEAFKARKEMTRFRESLQSMLASKSNRKLGAVTWEISRDRNVHLIWQLVALPADLVERGLAEAAFRVEADNHKYPAFVSKEFASLEEEAAYGDFFRVWLWCESDGADRVKSKTLVMPLDRDMRFDLQFGRRAVAKLLGLEKRTVWQDCQQTEEEETKDTEAFREAFKEWDFTLE